MHLPSVLVNLATHATGDIVASQLHRIPHADIAAKAYAEGQPLEVIIGLCLEATASLKDDELAGKIGGVLTFIEKEVPLILSKVSHLPFKDVVAELLKPWPIALEFVTTSIEKLAQ